MKIGDHEFVFTVTHGEYGSSTKFFDAKSTFKRRKYLLFGPIVEVPRFAFSVPFDIYDPTVTKEQCNKAVMEAYNYWLGTLTRKEEIRRKEFI